jgi:ABC-type uncharacterized transport system substrate-binding protein
MITDAIRKLWPSFAIIVAIGAILILTDTKSKSSAEVEIQKKVAVFKFSSRQNLDDTEKGFIDGLAQQQFIDGQRVAITRYNSENDLPTAHTIATEIVSRGYDIVLTASTPALQVVANANKEGKVYHAFGAVTDPFHSGVGIDPNDQFNRPKWLAGIGTFQPVKRAFIIARELNPGLKKVGVVWCTAETCSEACVKLARLVCDSLHIDLLENTVDNSTGVYESAKSLVSRGVEAIWIGGDNTVEIAAAMVFKAANEGGIPVFTNNIDHPALGAIFGVGANYYQVGTTVGKMAAEILNGKKPNQFPIENVVPEKLVINGQKVEMYNRQNWAITGNLKKIADKIL